MYMMFELYDSAAKYSRVVMFTDTRIDCYTDRYT